MKRAHHRVDFTGKVRIEPIVAATIPCFHCFYHHNIMFCTFSIPKCMYYAGASETIAKEFPELDYILSCDVIEESSSW